MSANWNFCVMGQGTWSPLIELESRALCEKDRTHLLHVTNESGLEKHALSEALGAERTQLGKLSEIQIRNL